MLTYGRLNSSCQISLPYENAGSTSNSSNDGMGRWGRIRKDSYMEPHKILASQRYTFATCQNNLVIHDCKMERMSESILHGFEDKSGVKVLEILQIPIFFCLRN